MFGLCETKSYKYLILSNFDVAQQILILVYELLYYSTIECFHVLKASHALAPLILILLDKKVEAQGGQKHAQGHSANK